MNRAIPTKLVSKSVISVAFLFALSAPLAADDRDPQQKTEPQVSDPAAVVAGPHALAHDGVVAGGPATAQLRLTPVATHPGGAYNTGGYYTSANITGQRLKVGLGVGGRTYWNAQISGWAPDQIRGYQFTIPDSSLLGTNADCGGGPGSCPGAGSLTYALQACNTSADCTNAFGESGVSALDQSVCQDGFCHSIFVNRTRSDWTHAGIPLVWAGYGVSTQARSVWSLSDNPLQTVTDTGLNYYGGTIVIDVPATARGLYTINWNTSNLYTYLFDGASPSNLIPLAAIIPGELEVACLCDANVNNDGSVNVIDEAIVLDCINGNCAGCVDSCDVNCDGTVDWVDMGVVRCQLQGFTNCCSAPTGACLGMNVGIDYEPCQVTTTMSCNWFAGTYLGNNTTCTGCVCNADVNNSGTVNVIDAACVADCTEGRGCACCVNGCDANCDQTVNWTDFAAVWCEFEGGTDCCNVAIGACVPTNPSWPQCVETSQNACESNGGAYSGDGSTCGALCPATRVFEDAEYCPGRVDLVRLQLSSLADASSVAVEDSPPPGWTVGAISNGGGYDAVNHKVKWLFFSPPFPAELTYEVTPDNAATGLQCFSGVASVDGLNRTICGDDCLVYQCCPHIAAETLQPVCESCAAGNCAACTSGSCEDGSVSLCEVIAYGCAWVRGCNDDIAAVTRAAYVWRNGECYCWDDAVQNFIPATCGGSTCCPGAPTASAADYSPAIGRAWASIRRDGLRVGGSRSWQISIRVAPVIGTSAMAAELSLPDNWKVLAVGEEGAFDRENGKIKWGPFFGDASQTLTATVRPDMKHFTSKTDPAMEAKVRSLRGTVSFDGINTPITITR